MDFDDELENFQNGLVQRWAEQRAKGAKSILDDRSQDKLREASARITDIIAELTENITAESQDGIFALNLLVSIKNNLDDGIESQQERLKAWLR